MRQMTRAASGPQTKHFSPISATTVDTYKHTDLSSTNTTFAYMCSSYNSFHTHCLFFIFSFFLQVNTGQKNKLLTIRYLPSFQFCLVYHVLSLPQTLVPLIQFYDFPFSYHGHPRLYYLLVREE
eukprot:GHVS01036496.1.p1 GENE.GHVS01036496.1~~GHVS01036496.1.p1  ORF type:complete len:124 (-),score=6.29 GHVS01036496.1:66-437(-)